MNEINNLKKKIKYRAIYRGTKEMDLLLGNFVRKYINSFSIKDLYDLYKLLDNSDDDLTKCVLNKDTRVKIPNNNVVKLLKNFRID